MKKARRASWLAGVLFSCQILLVAAQPTYEMSFDSLTLVDGLSQNTVMDILQDSYGYLWFATENGLDRYDGYSLHSYRRGDGRAGELANDYIWQIAEDERGDLWLATDGGGVAFWDRKKDGFRHFRHNPDDTNTLPSDRIRALQLTTSGLWVATLDGGLAFLDPTTGGVTRFQHRSGDRSSLPSNEVFALLLDKSGRLWVGTEAGLAVRDPVTKKFTWLQHDPDNPYSLSHNRVRTLFEDQHGAVWVGTFGGGLSMLDPRSGRFTHYRLNEEIGGTLSDDNVRAVFEDAADRLWVGTASGLNVLLPGAQEFKQYVGGREIGDLTDSYIMSLYQDRGGVLWVGTRTGGVNAWNSESWKFGHSKPDWLENHSVSSFASDQTGYWVGTFGRGLHYVNEIEQTTTGAASSGEALVLSDDRVMALLKDSHGGLWVGTMEGGINWLQPGADSFTVLAHDPSDANSLSADGVMSIFEDSRGAIWFGTFGGGVTRLEPDTRRFSRYLPGDDDSRSLCGAQARAFAEDSFGGIWIGTEQGLCRYDPDRGMFHAFRHDPRDPASLAENSVYALHIDPEGRLWAGTGGGGLSETQGRLNEPEGISFRNHSRKSGLSSDSVYAVLPGSDSMLWLSGNNGLTRFNPRDATATNYSSAQGLQGEEFHFGAAHRSVDGRLFFGGANGANIFDPLRLDSQTSAPQLALTSISLMNERLEDTQPLSTVSELELDYRDIALTLEFAALDFTAPQRNQYAYKLEGFDSGWVSAGTRRTATYTNLPGGDYVFRLRAAGSAGVWNEESLTLDIHVGQAPWKTLWAYLGYAVILLGLLGLFVRAQNRKLQREAEYSAKLKVRVRERTLELEHSNRELQRLGQARVEFLARMTHEIRSPMNGVLGMAEMLRRTSLSSVQEKYAATILNSADSLLRIIDDILDFSKLDSGKLELDLIETDLEQLINDTLAMFGLEARKKGLQLVSLLPPSGLPLLKADALRLRQVFVNLLSNAIKFTDQGSVRLAVDLMASDAGSIRLRFSVSDTGIGIAQESQEHIFESFSQEDSSTTRRFGGTGLGLTISRELIEAMNGNLSLQSSVGAGAIFSFELSLAKLHPGAEADRLPTFDASAFLVCAGGAQLHQFERYLNDWGVSTQSRSTGLAALDALSDVAVQTADLLIVGSQLPDMPGVELVRKLRHKGLPDTASIVLLCDVDATGELLLPPGVRQFKEPVTRAELHMLLTSTLGDAHVPLHPAVSQKTVEEELRMQGRVLLVEDNAVNQEVLVAMLSALGCGVDVASDGRTGVQMARSNHYDAVLMDYRLPDFDGVEATRRIRDGEETGSRLPIIAFTANSAGEDRARCRSAGMDDFLPKPCTVVALEETLSRWIPLSAKDTATKDTAAKDTAHGAVASHTGAEISRFDTKNLVQISELRRPDGSGLLSYAVDVFFRTSDESLQMIASAVQQQDAGHLRSAAHKLKSGCDNLGAVSMAAVCRELENMGERRDLSGAAALVPKLRNEHSMAIAWLKEQVRELA